MAIVRKLMRDTRGATAIEYALIASLISIAGISAFASVGQGVNARFTTVQQKVSNTL
jgi:pilus assembly protein Flp/PilA